MKYLKTFENLTNSNINKIYIWFDFSIIESVLENGVAFKSNDDSRYKYNLSISTTRNPKWRWGGGNCRITLDRNQISKIYKIVPYSHFGFKEWEERIFTNKNIKYLPTSFFIKIELDESLKKNILPPTNIKIEYTNFTKSRIDAHGARYILPKRQPLKTFENHKSIGKEIDIKDTIKNLRGVSKENKDLAIGLLKSYTKAGKGKITGLELHPELKKKISDGEYPSGYDMGIDKDGFFIHTHRARSKSHEKPNGITAKEMKFIDSTG